MKTTLEETIRRIQRDLLNRPLKQESPPPLTDLTTTDTCPLCGGLEWIYGRKEDGCEYARPCKCQEQARLSRRLKFASLPEAFGGMELKTFRSDVYRRQESKAQIALACKIIKKYLDDFEGMHGRGMGLYLYSQTKGSGKTRMVASIANYLIREKGYQVKFATSLRILQEIKNTWNRETAQSSESQLLQDLAGTDILIIDDFGVEAPAGWINDKYYQIINDRYISKKVTIYTSNQTIDTLRYDERIVSRIKERSFLISFPDESVRELIADQNNREMLERIEGGKDGKTIYTNRI